MSGLWTVTINRLHLVKRFDDKGNKVSETVTKIPVTFHDLPYSTALMYQEKAPGETTLVQQIREVAPTRKNFKERVNRYERADQTPPANLGSEDLSTEATAISDAAASGDFGAAITAELEAAS